MAFNLFDHINVLASLTDCEDSSKLAEGKSFNWQPLHHGISVKTHLEDGLDCNDWLIEEGIDPSAVRVSLWQCPSGDIKAVWHFKKSSKDAATRFKLTFGGK